MSVLAAIGREDVARYVETLFLVYIILIFIRIVMSWVPRIPYNRYLAAVLGFVQEVTDPYLGMFRKVLPMVRLGPAGLDLSPIVGVFVLLILQAVLVSAILP